MMGQKKNYNSKKHKITKNKLDKKLAGYSAAAVAALACGVPFANAAPVITTPVSPGTLYVQGSYLVDMNNDDHMDFGFQLFSAWSRTFYAFGISNYASVAVAGFLVDRFDSGDIIDANQAFGANRYLANGYSGLFYGENDNGFVGVRFNIDDALHYGWINIEMTGISILTIHSWGYETDANTPIIAGSEAPIPEPASLSLLAMGAAGLFAWKGKRKEED